MRGDCSRHLLRWYGGGNGAFMFGWGCVAVAECSPATRALVGESVYLATATLADGIGEYANRFHFNLFGRDFTACAFLIEPDSEVAYDLIALSTLQACVRDGY
jgi:hypothetical protein